MKQINNNFDIEMHFWQEYKTTQMVGLLVCFCTICFIFLPLVDFWGGVNLNLKQLYTASSAEIKVCGESVNLVSVSEQVVSVKQKKDKDVNKTSCKLFRTGRK